MYSSLYIPQTVFSDAPCFQRCPLWPRPGRAVSRRRGMEKRRQGRLGGGRTYVLQKSQGDASRRPRWGPAFAPSMTLGNSPFSRVESTPLPTTRAINVGGSYLRIRRTLRRLQAVTPPCHMARASTSQEAATVARESPPRDLQASDLGKCPLAGVSSGS